MPTTSAYSKAETPSKSESARAILSKRRHIRLIRIMSLTIILTVAGRGGYCQQAVKPTIDVPARQRDILAHLSSMIQYRRSATASIQKAGEPKDAVYREQADTLSSQAFAHAFEWAKAEAQLAAATSNDATDSSSALTSEQYSLNRLEKDLDARIKKLQLELDSFHGRGPGKKRAGDADQQIIHLKNSIEFLSTIRDAALRISNTADTNNGRGLLASLYLLEHSVPELQGNVKSTSELISTNISRSTGVTSQIGILLDLAETRRSLDGMVKDSEKVRKEAQQLSGPINAEIVKLMQKGEQETSTAGADLSPEIVRFKSLSAAAVPLGEEIFVLEKSRNNLAAWQASVDREYRQVLSAILSRIIVIGVMLAAIFIGGEVWVRVARRYVRDQRRRRQLLIVGRVVVGFLSVFVLIFGFISNFSSIATFAGFLTAGVAVGLQTILLSVAAYFFIVGKYGIKIGDRITIASVTGEVIDVGPVRFYLLELVFSGTELRPTGRVAVFSNAVLFQAGTPLYKQIPGNDYSWRELTVTLTDSADHEIVRQAIAGEIERIYRDYQGEVERQHGYVQAWLQASIEPPVVESRLLVASGAFNVWVRFPVRMRYESETDEKITRALRELMAKRPEFKNALSSIPVLQPSVKM